ncbi:hypothetical protein K8R62_00745 [bacterium]|nr:hypothetical protein [bacterium]
MKKLNLFVILAIVTCFFSGCAGVRKAEVETDATGNIKQWDDSNYSVLQPSVSPTEIGRANVLNSKADLNRALAVQVARGNVAEVAGSYVGILINQDKRYTVSVQHPTRSDILQISPGDSMFIRSTDIPRCLYVCYPDDKDFVKIRAFKKTLVYDGVKTDYGVRIKNR